MTLRIISIAILLVCCVQSTGFAITNEGIFSQFQFTFITPGARATSMGGAFIGLADDATAAELNPAGLTQLEYPEVFADFAHITYTTKQIYENYYLYTDIRWEEWNNSVAGAPFISVVSPYKSFAFSLYRQEMVNHEMSFQTSGRWMRIPGPYDIITLPIKSDMAIKVTN